MSECLIVIPARFKSTRLPGKPLRKICSEARMDGVGVLHSLRTKNITLSIYLLIQFIIFF